MVENSSVTDVAAPMAAFRLPSLDSSIWSIDLTKNNNIQSTNSEDDSLSFAPLPKMDRLGRLADWTGQTVDQNRLRNQSTANQQQQQLYARNEEEEEGWSISTALATAAAGAGKRTLGSAQVIRPPTGSKATGANKNTSTASGSSMRRGGVKSFNFHHTTPVLIREPSIQIPPGWRVIEEIEFGRLAKLQLDPDEPEILKAGHSGRAYDRSWEKTTTRMERVLASGPNDGGECQSEDPSTVESTADTLVVITTDSVASLLMACTRTLTPWDLVIERGAGGIIRLTRRPESQVDAVLVNETAADPPNPEDAGANGAKSLAKEATRVNRDLIHQVSKAAANNDHQQKRLSAWNLGNGIRLLVQGSLHASARALTSGEEQEVHLRALLEYDQLKSSSVTTQSAMDWRQRLDTQRGAVLAYEIKNNNAQMARWVYQAILSSVPAIKLGFVSRTNSASRTQTRHHLLALLDLDPEDLAVQMSLNVPGGFGILRAIIEQCRGLPEGRYCLLRDPNKAVLRLYSQQ